MRFFFLAALVLAAGTRAPAAAAAPVHTVTYYSGTAELTFLPSGQKSSEQGVLVRTVDSEHGLLTEVLCGKAPGRPAFVSPVYMRVDDDGRLTISDRADFALPRTLTGTGSVVGPAWDWTYLSFDMTYEAPGGAYHIVDANFVDGGGSTIVARKQIFDAHGTPVELYDETMTRIDAETYAATLASLGCPAL